MARKPRDLKVRDLEIAMMEKAEKYNYPMFKIYEPCAAEIELENHQRPILNKLSDAGYGVKVADDTFMDMPCMVDSNSLPLEVYCFNSETPVFVNIFNKWEEIVEFAGTVN